GDTIADRRSFWFGFNQASIAKNPQVLREGRLSLRRVVRKMQQYLITNTAWMTSNKAHDLNPHRITQRFAHSPQLFIVNGEFCRHRRRPPSMLNREKLFLMPFGLGRVHSASSYDKPSSILVPDSVIP